MESTFAVIFSTYIDFPFWSIILYKNHFQVSVDNFKLSVVRLLQRGVRLIRSLVTVKWQKWQGPTEGVCLKEVCVKRELTVASYGGLIHICWGHPCLFRWQPPPPPPPPPPEFKKHTLTTLPNHLSSSCLLYKYWERGLELRHIRIYNKKKS